MGKINSRDIYGIKTWSTAAEKDPTLFISDATVESADFYPINSGCLAKSIVTVVQIIL
jgi:hypothetical protein